MTLSKDQVSTLMERTKAIFGTTEDLSNAGYLLPDGSLLDFSNELGSLLCREQIEILRVEGVPRLSHTDFMHAGFIYVCMRRAFFKIKVAPGRLQAERFISLFQELDGTRIAVELSGTSDHVFEAGTPPEKILSDIASFYSGTGFTPNGNRSEVESRTYGFMCERTETINKAPAIPLSERMTRVICEKAKARFGTTQDPCRAGFILPDGCLLMLPELPNGALGPHCQIDSVQLVGFPDLRDFDYLKSGFIRIAVSERGYEILKRPSPAQIPVLRRLLMQQRGEGIFVDIGDTARMFGPDSSVGKILSVILGYFDGEEIDGPSCPLSLGPCFYENALDLSARGFLERTPGGDYLQQLSAIDARLEARKKAGLPRYIPS